MRGEYQNSSLKESAISGSPPLARGIRRWSATSWLWCGITPACAGNTMAALSRLGRSRDHPRLRGEYFHSSQALRANGGSPPLARGIRFWFWDPKEETRITPACAGNTGYKKFCPQRAEDHPRLRGEYYTSTGVNTFAIGSPPLARGIHKDSSLVGC